MVNKRFDELNKENIVSFLQDVFDRCGNEEYLGEDVTMAEHMLQGATLAELRGYSEDIIVAALLHDIGHFTGQFGAFSMLDRFDRYHEESGATMLADFFPSVVIDCIKHHVAAKRYLCATEPKYLSKLSKASIHSLKLQGGPMSSTEVAEFQKKPNLDKIIQVRYLDDEGKNPGMKTPNFDYFAPMVQRLVDFHDIVRDL